MTRTKQLIDCEIKNIKKKFIKKKFISDREKTTFKKRFSNQKNYLI